MCLDGLAAVAMPSLSVGAGRYQSYLAPTCAKRPDLTDFGPRVE